MTLGDFTEIIIDSNEKVKHLMKRAFLDLEYYAEFKNLDTYDYMQGNVGVERKTIPDFISSFKDKKDRMWDQLARMSQNVDNSYLLIQVEEQDLWMIDNSVHGAMGSIAVRYGITPGFTFQLEGFCWEVGKIFKSHREGKKGKARRLSVKPPEKYDNAAIAILASTDGIGHDLAIRIANTLELETIHHVATLTMEELQTVKGIKNKAGKIIDWLGI